MPYWWEFDADLVGDRGHADAPRLPMRQVRQLYERSPELLDDPDRSSSWGLLVWRPRFGRRSWTR